MDRRIKFFVDRDTFGHNLRLFLTEMHGETVTHVAKTLEGGEMSFEPYEKGMITEPTLLLHEDEARSLIEALTGAGVKPHEISKAEGVLEASKVHLEDMRKLTGDLMVLVASTFKEKS